MSRLISAWLSLVTLTVAAPQEPPEPNSKPIPDKVVVLTFDDSVKSHFTFVRPLLLEHGFGATFFITEGFEFARDKRNYMSWEEIAHLNADGFEIGNHTRDHMTVRESTLAKLPEQLSAIDRKCEQFGIPKPISFAYPGNGTHPKAFDILKAHGIHFARRGGSPEYPYEKGQGFAYEPGFDHPLLLPSAGDARPDWTLDDFKRAADQARSGRIAVLQFHGVPDLAHPWVNSPIDRFKQYMQYLKDNDFTVIAMRDLAKYEGTNVEPSNAQGIIADRKRAVRLKTSRDDFRLPGDTAPLKSWLTNMVMHHGFTVAEVRAATGLSDKAVRDHLKTWRLQHTPTTPSDGSLRVLPYPGGRHPRSGFLDGAIRPQRDTKLSVFLPWAPEQYVVLDVPEAIRRNDEAKHGLLYLAHDHVPTMWTKQDKPLGKLEWNRIESGYEFERVLPNGIRFGTRVQQRPKHQLRMEMWLHNRSEEDLANLVVQNCVMVKAAPDFANSTVRKIRKPFIAVRATTEEPHWMIVGWTPCHRAWQNPPCPCLHSDPKFADCKAGESSRVRGWLSFFHGNDIDAELERIEQSGG